MSSHHGAVRIELTHDVLTGVVREHRDRRMAEEEKAALVAVAEAQRESEREGAQIEMAARAALQRRMRGLQALSVVLITAVIVLAVLLFLA